MGLSLILLSLGQLAKYYLLFFFHLEYIWIGLILSVSVSVFFPSSISRSPKIHCTRINKADGFVYVCLCVCSIERGEGFKIGDLGYVWIWLKHLCLRFSFFFFFFTRFLDLRLLFMHCSMNSSRKV